MFRVSHTRVEYCGQREQDARSNGGNTHTYTRLRNAYREHRHPIVPRSYCLHFHVLGHCPSCLFRGNALDTSHHRGLVVHGTHDALVEGNIMWDTVRAHCIHTCIQTHRQTDRHAHLLAQRVMGIYIEDGNERNNTIVRNVVICSERDLCAVKEMTGIYIIGQDNRFIENRVAFWFITIFTPGG